MAYNSYFPVGYQPMQMYQPQQQMAQPQPQQGNSFQNGTSSLTWVQGEGAAKSYLVAPGCTVALFDNESQTIYIKSADASGMPSMRVLDYTFRESTPQKANNSPLSNYATKEDVSLIREELDALRAKFEDTKGAKK